MIAVGKILAVLKRLEVIRKFLERDSKKNNEYFLHTFTKTTRCRPSKGRRCIHDVDIQVHVETYLNVDFSSSAQVKIQVKFNFELFWKKNQIFWFPCCSTREDLSIDASITNVGLILTKLRGFLFSLYGQTDRHGFGTLTWKHIGTQKISTQSSKLVVSCRSLYASPEVGDA